MNFLGARAPLPLSPVSYAYEIKYHNVSYIYRSRCLQGGPKNLAPFFLYALTLSNINRFS